MSINYFRAFGQGKITRDSLEYISTFSKFTKLIFIISSPKNGSTEIMSHISLRSNH